MTPPRPRARPSSSMFCAEFPFQDVAEIHCHSRAGPYTAANATHAMKPYAFALLGAVAGGVIGYFGFLWIAGQGFYALVLPGGLLGVGASLAQNRSTAVCVICGLLALALGFVAEWRFAPFIKDVSFSYFLTHVHQLRPITLIMIAAGAVIGFWAPFSRRQLLAGA